MQTFKDSKGREWALNFTIADAFRFKRELKIDVDLLTRGDDGEIERILCDGWRIVEILVALLGPQIERAGLLEKFEENGVEKFRPSDDFYEGLGGEVLDEASVCFLRAVASSLPKLKRRALLAMIEKLSPTIEMAAGKLEEKIRTKDLTEEITEAIRVL